MPHVSLELDDPQRLQIPPPPVRKASSPGLFALLREKLKAWCRLMTARTEHILMGLKTRLRKQSVKPSLEALEDLVLPSVSTINASVGGAAQGGRGGGVVG